MEKKETSSEPEDTSPLNREDATVPELKAYGRELVQELDREQAQKKPWLGKTLLSGFVMLLALVYPCVLTSFQPDAPKWAVTLSILLGLGFGCRWVFSLRKLLGYADRIREKRDEFYRVKCAITERKGKPIPLNQDSQELSAVWRPWIHEDAEDYWEEYN
ncbi:MAG: hypothetical protein IJQ02_01025 [Oscillospiraceae bacterium]|nr:hypothetical protein [Oscillospiraceae bacterium]